MTNQPSDNLAAFIAPLGNAGPITVAVMVSSADGHATVGGHVGELTGKPDQKVLLGAREMAAAVVVGGNTVRAEGYDGLLDEQAQARRKARGLPREPDLMVIARSGESVPGHARHLVAPTLPDGKPDLRAAWRDLRQAHPDSLIVSEGGPTILGMLVEQGVLDQLILCLSPTLVGGDGGKRILESRNPLPDAPLKLQTLDVATAGGFVFVRYGVST